MMEAWGERSPIIFVTGSSTLKRQGSGGFKEIDDVAIAAPLTKYSVSITDGERISEFVDRAWKIALSGYPGAVHLSLPVDIMFSSFEETAMRDERPFDRGAGRPARAWPCPEDLEQALDKIRAAKKPIIIGGHGIWWSAAEAALEDCARKLNIPVFNVPYHQKLLSEGSDVYMGLADVHQYHPSKQAIEESDVVIMVGTRLDNQMNFGNAPLFPVSTHLICVNGSPEEIEMNRAADQALLSDPGAFFSALSELEPLASQWLETNREWRAQWVKRMVDEIPLLDDGRIHPLQLALDVQAAMSDDDWLVIDGGNTHFWSEISVNIAGWHGLKLGNILHPGTFSMLGVGVPFASVAKLVNPHKNVLVISGDGAFLSGGFGIEAAFQEKLPIVVVIDNNGGLDCISQQQERLFANQQHFATDFRDIPFHSMFEGLGGHGELVEHRDDIVPAIKRAVASGKTACVNVRTVGHISPIVLATTSKRDKASIE
jgi:acetolactate synthase-1/2/3 large subunit